MATYSTPTNASAGNAVAELRRKDTWWVQPVATTLIFVLFVIYSTWRAFEGKFYDTYETWNVVNLFSAERAPILYSPFYSPHIPLDWHIGSWPISPALYVLIFPLSFRGTCYFCRRAYYRAFFWDPPACAVPEGPTKRNYTGEKEFPMTVQNLHRYTWYAAVILVFFHWHHVYESFFALNASGARFFSPGLGTAIFVFDTVFLTLYTFSCHSWRHFIGGGLDRFSTNSGTELRGKLWNFFTKLNERHGVYFWISLVAVATSDLYVRLVAAGIIRGSFI